MSGPTLDAHKAGAVPKLSARRGRIEISGHPSFVVKRDKSAVTRGVLLVEPAGDADAIKTHRDWHYRGSRLSMMAATGNDDGASRNDPNDQTTDHLFWEIGIRLTR